MKTIYLPLFLLFILFVKPIAAQTLEVFSPEVSKRSYAHTLHEKAYFGQGDNNFFSSYDGETLININFPSSDGRRLRYHPYHNEMIVHTGNIYMVLHDIEHYREDVSETRRYFYRFNGTSFTYLPLPGKPVSNPMVFQEEIYILIQIGTQVKLFNFNGASALEIPASSLNPDRTHRLLVAGSYLYASGDDSGNLMLKRYNGSRIENLPSFNCGLDITIHDVPGTGQLYIDEDNFRLFHYNGTEIRQIYLLYGSFTIWNEVAYFIEGYSSSFYAILRHDGFRTTAIVLPDEARPHDMTVYRNELHITAHTGETDYWLYIYDGTTFRRTFLSSQSGFPAFQFKRGDNLMQVINNDENPANILAYNGDDFHPIHGPERNKVLKYLTSTPCFHLWETFTYDADRNKIYKIAKENKNCPPRYSIIPEHLRNFERFDFRMYGKYRGWCWSELIWDWELNPECPFCPEPRFEASMADSKGNIAWKETFKMPFNIKIPLEDNQPYTLTLSSFDENSTKNFFVIGEDLVSLGFSSIEMNMVPEKEYFHLKAETKDGKNIPFAISLLNDKGEAIWNGEFMAPFDSEILAKVDKPGTTLQISSNVEGLKKQKNLSFQMTSSPNPFYDKLEVDIQAFDKTESNVELSIINLSGEILFKKNLLAPAIETINLSTQKSGIYILRMVSGSEVHTKLIKLER